jgi:hypothetical protein
VNETAKAIRDLGLLLWSAIVTAACIIGISINYGGRP